MCIFFFGGGVEWQFYGRWVLHAVCKKRTTVSTRVIYNSKNTSVIYNSKNTSVIYNSKNTFVIYLVDGSFKNVTLVPAIFQCFLY